MICSDCRISEHKMCRGGSYCDCQHKAAVLTEPKTAGADYADDDGEVYANVGSDGVELAR